MAILITGATGIVGSGLWPLTMHLDPYFLVRDIEKAKQNGIPPEKLVAGNIAQKRLGEKTQLLMC